MSGSPKGTAAASATAWMPSREPRSPTTPAARHPCAFSSSTVSAMRSAPRATITVAAPARGGKVPATSAARVEFPAPVVPTKATP